MSGNLLSDRSVNDLGEVLDWFRNVGPAGLPQPHSPENPRRVEKPHYNLRGHLLQDLAGNETALFAQVVRVPTDNSWQVDLFGLWNASDLGFTLQLKYDETSIWTTAPIASPNGLASAEDVQAAIVAASGMAESDVVVSFGNPTYSPHFQDNTFFDVPDGNNPSGAILENNVGTWLIHLRSIDNPAYSLVARQTSGGLIQDTSVVVSRKTFEKFTGYTDICFDAFGQSRSAPIRAGSKVILMWFYDSGYGVVGASQKDFAVLEDEG